ncbi:glycosyltransferase family 4 protein [Rosistilla oblonga]|uniref:glycosyltransferase family 4 protein n=1 Tax=Rosistilla oblonga TaxID=2527990 RepID=UPI003A971EA5
MHIALLTNGVPPIVNGGMQQYALNMAIQLAELGNSIDLYSTSDPKDQRLQALFTEDQKRRIKFFTVPWPQSPRLPGHYIRESIEISRQFAKNLLKQKPVQIVYGHGLTNIGMIEARERGASLPPIVTHGHGYEMFQSPATLTEKLKQVLLQRTVRKLLAGSDYIVSLGGNLTHILETKLSIPTTKIIETPVAVDSKWITTRPTPPPELGSGLRRRITYLGRYERRKGIEELATACRALSPLDFELHLIGPIPKSQLSRFPPGVVAHGPVYHSGRLFELLDATDILVCPSWSEGMPTVILEAMARRTAILASDVGAIDVIVDHTNGWLVPHGNAHKLQEKLAHATTLPDDILQGMKIASKNRVIANYTWPQVAKLISSQLHAILSQRAPN